MFFEADRLAHFRRQMILANSEDFPRERRQDPPEHSATIFRQLFSGLLEDRPLHNPSMDRLHEFLPHSEGRISKPWRRSIGRSGRASWMGPGK